MILNLYLINVLINFFLEVLERREIFEALEGDVILLLSRKRKKKSNI